MAKITNEQIRKIHALVNRMGWKDEWYKDTLFDRYRVWTSKKLSSSQAQDFIRRLEGEAIGMRVWVKPARKYDHLVNRPGMATPGQLRMIDAIWKEVCWYGDPKERKEALRELMQNKLSSFQLTEKDVKELKEKGIGDEWWLENSLDKIYTKTGLKKELTGERYSSEHIEIILNYAYKAGPSDLAFLTKSKAHQLITILKMMKARQVKLERSA